MRYKLILGDRIYSSWSLRGWLITRLAELDPETEFLRFDAGPVRDQVAAYAPADTVPLLVTPDGIAIGDSLAIAEELASRFPQCQVLPQNPAKRAVARILMAAMHSGFGTLRNDCPMDLARAYKNVPVPDALQQDLTRIEALWSWARATCESNTPWLCGDYSAADAFYAPVAARIAGYDLPVGAAARAYVNAHLNHLGFRQWRAMGLATDTPLERYARPHTRTDWPVASDAGNFPPARKCSLGTPENTACPYSGKPVNWLMEINGRTFGMCNQVCRDKTVADPGAWPDFVKIYQS